MGRKSFTTEHLCLEFPGVDERVAVGASAWFRDVRTEGFQGESGP